MYIYVIALLGSFLAGCINTLAGNGSAITLTILTELLGLPPTIANATNRVGVLTQSGAATAAFQQQGRLGIPGSRAIVGYTVVGAIGGIYLAITVSNEQFQQVFRYLMIVMLVVILVNPKRWLQPTDSSKRPAAWITAPCYLALGFHAGFIQMGMGVLFLATTVLIARYGLIDANVIKSVVVTVITALALAIFAWRGLIDWPLGLLLAIGQTLGGYLTARYAARDPRAAIWAYRLLIVVVVAAVLRLFGWY